MKEKIFAVFVNYNFGSQLATRIKQVLSYPSVSGVVVVDNASFDNSVALAKKVDSGNKTLEFIVKKNNLGFDKGVNIAIKRALALGADYIIPLDTDVQLKKDDFIAKLYEADGDYTVPILKFPRDGKWVYDYGGRVNWLLGRTTHLETSKLLDPDKVAISSNDRTTDNWFDFVSGGCTLIKKEVFNCIGGFDEDYFLYFGDSDHALRARERGFKVVVTPKVVMWHKLQEHKKTLNWHKIKLTFQGNLVFIRKWVPWYFKPVAYSYFSLLLGKVLMTVVSNRLSASRHQ